MLEKIPVMTSWGIPASVSLVQNTCSKNGNTCNQIENYYFLNSPASILTQGVKSINTDKEISMLLFIHRNLVMNQHSGLINYTNMKYKHLDLLFDSLKCHFHWLIYKML